MGNFFNSKLKDMHKLPESKTVENMRKESNAVPLTLPPPERKVDGWAKAREAKRLKREAKGV